MLVFSFPFLCLNLFSGVLVALLPAHSELVNPRVWGLANTATLFVQLFGGSQ